LQRSPQALRLRDRLIAHGHAATTAFALIENGARCCIATLLP